MTSDTPDADVHITFGHPRRGMTDNLVIEVDRDLNQLFLDSQGPFFTLHDGSCIVPEETAAKMLGDKK